MNINSMVKYAISFGHAVCQIKWVKKKAHCLILSNSPAQAAAILTFQGVGQLG